MTENAKVTPLKSAQDAAQLTGAKYVRVRKMRDDGFVEFDFSIGDPMLYVELILPSTAFNEFCNSNGVKFLSDDEAAALDADRRRWRQGFISQEGDERLEDGP